MNNIFSRKFFIILGIVSLVLFLVFLQDKNTNFLCSIKNYECYNLVDFISLILVFFISLFIPSLISFLSNKKEVFNFWRKTVPIYSLIYLVIVIFLPWNSGDFIPIDKWEVSIFLAIFYSIISLFLIIYKSLKE